MGMDAVMPTSPTGPTPDVGPWSLVSAHLGRRCLPASTRCWRLGRGDQEEVWGGVGQDWGLI